MSRYILLEGWLTKSPPHRSIFKTKWRKRWFSLRQSNDLPGQYFLDYYGERSCRRLKGSINLDLCEQVDAGLMTQNSNTQLDPAERGCVFSIQTKERTYHLEAACEEDMEKWVDAICRVCGLRATLPSEEEERTRSTYQNSTMTVMNDQYELAEGTGPYIPISECITGVRAPVLDFPCNDSQRTFTFDPNNIIIGSKSSFDAVSEKSQQIYLSHPQIRVNNDFSENESNLSDEECKSLNASQSNIADDWSLTRTYIRPGPLDRLEHFKAYSGGNVPVRPAFVRPERKPTGCLGQAASCLGQCDASEEGDGPPVPPRPPKTITLSREHRDSYQGPRLREPGSHPNLDWSNPPYSWEVSSRRLSHVPATQSLAQALPLTHVQSRAQVHVHTHQAQVQAPPYQAQAQALPFQSQAQALPYQAQAQALPYQSQAQALPLQSQAQALPFQSQAQALPFQSQAQALPLQSQAQALPYQSQAQALPTVIVHRPRNDDDDETGLAHPMQHYCNLSLLPPAVDRALKPRIASTSIGHVNQVGQLFQNAAQPSTSVARTRRASDVLQYLDLDLSSPKSPAKNQDGVRRVHHAKSFSAESRADYKTVDFVKTEAFNITRQDAEASRSVQQ
ncbi:uncharacterized protein LOC123705444 isoform X2 [Colias croceus]|uniref:uncharacterized protein LOC123705444 isoform X2 n=1 Tax=Colias crocea TaxID=72248 RepID=UPI001E27EDD5|nr:uncharacterized protein LOC123705444 isoform X2 [Colias croceus]